MKGCAWVIAVDMGYGHQRAAYPLKDIAYEKILTANSDKMISYEEKNIWERNRAVYESVSRLKRFPIIGESIFNLYNKVLEISPFFPFRDLSKPSMGVLWLKRSLEKGLCASLIEYISKKELPIITTHPFPALAAHYHGLNNIYCIVTDTDISRGWVCADPKKNNITYLAPCIQVAVRLREYGIKEENIILTGFPLPKENIGNNFSILKKDLQDRLVNLDPNRIFINSYKETITKKLGKLPKPSRPLTITYAVGGAGAQIEVGVKIIRSLKEKILSGVVKVNVVAGTRLDVLSYYKKELKGLGINNIDIVFALEKKEYFAKFNQALRTTDILWTKPSELSFYTALGLPIIIAPPIGAQEVYNMKWLSNMGSGFVQENPDFTDDWLFYWLQDGRLAKVAWQGWLEAPSLGTYNVEKLVSGGQKNLKIPTYKIPIQL